MFKRHLLFNSTYLMVAGLNVWSVAWEVEVLKMVSMPLIGMSNILYLLILTRLRSLFSIKIFFSLMLAMGGDVLLLFNNGAGDLFFAAIVATFSGYILVAYACYEDWNDGDSLQIWPAFYLVITCMVSGLSYFIFLSKYVGEYKIPVIIHFFVLLVLPISASLRHKKVNTSSFRLIVGAVACFTVSDYSIAYNSFVREHTFLMIIYILAYLLAQYMLVIGTIERKVFNGR